MNIFKKPVVLLADDNQQNLQFLASVIEEIGFEPTLANNGMQALEFVKMEKPDLILLDIVMPDIDGLKVCKMLKSQEETKGIPLIFITAMNNSEDIVSGFDAGGVDYITKPFNAKELISRVRTHMELKISKDRLEKANEDLKKMMRELEISSKTDFLTGLNNRMYMFDRIESEMVKFKRHKIPFSIMLADVDFFKKINDNHGHDCGDYVLKTLAQIMKSTVREQDTIARWGGEEFLILLPETPISGANILVNRLRDNINQTIFQYNEKIGLSIHLTYGISAFDGNGEAEQVIKRADEALYNGKKNGRNCIVIIE